MRKKSIPRWLANHSDSASSVRVAPSLARAMPTTLSRCKGGWALAPAEQRAMVRSASAGVMMPS